MTVEPLAADRLAQTDPEQLRAAIVEAQRRGDWKALRVLNRGLDAALAWRPQAHQLPPPGVPGKDWWAWVLRAGRGAGKSDVGAWFFDEHMKGPPCDARVPGGHRGVIVAPTFSDAISACWEAPAGLRAHNPELVKINRKEGTVVEWPNGAQAALLGAHSENDADRLRAHGNRCIFWFDEAAMMRHLTTAINNVALGARLGEFPHGVVTSTPKPYQAYLKLLGMPNVAQTVASTYQNQFLPESYRQVISQYEGTRIGQQELHGELLGEYEGALWRRDLIDAGRITEYPSSISDLVARFGIVRIAVGLDPSTWDPDLGDDPGTVGEGIETGIVVVGVDAQDPPNVYVLEDASLRGQAERWAAASCDAYHRWRATWVVPEVNLGGMVLSVIRMTDPDVPLYRVGTRVGVRAAQGKRARAEPVALLYDQGRAHHVGMFPELESQMVSWDPRESWSPDRIDALVWAVTALKPEQDVGSSSSLDQLLSARIPTR